MREILFRGKVDDTKEWIMGDLISHTYEKPNIRSIGSLSSYIVIPETVGQYTGKTDKNGKKIFEGDIIRELDGSMDDIPRLVRWDEVYMEFKCPLTRNHWAYGNNDCSFWLMQSENIEIIGNIHDNPELLGGATNV